MKLYFLALIFICSYLSYGQNPTQAHNDSIKLNNVNLKIDAVRTKRDFIKSDPVEDSIAVAQNWYAQNEEQLMRLFDTKKQIIASLNGKIWISKEEFETLPQEKKDILLQDSAYLIEPNN